MYTPSYIRYDLQNGRILDTELSDPYLSKVIEKV